MPNATLMVSPDDPLEGLHRVCAMMAAHLREEHRLIMEANRESDKAVVWLSGLMGAGLFAVQGLIATAPVSVRLVTLVPWTLGILLAMLGRLLGSAVNEKVTAEHLGRVSALELLQLQGDRSRIAQALNHLLEWASTPGEGDPTLKRQMYWTNAVFYLTHISLAVGSVGAATTFSLWGK